MSSEVGGHSGLRRELYVGASVVVDGRVCDVMELRGSGDVMVTDVMTGITRWVDYYTCDVVSPHRNPGALLEAMSSISTKEPDEVLGALRKILKSSTTELSY